MPSELDMMLALALDANIGEGKTFQLAEVESRGQMLPMIANAPPSLPFYFAHFCALHGDLTFLVDGDERLFRAAAYEGQPDGKQQRNDR